MERAVAETKAQAWKDMRGHGKRYLGGPKDFLTNRSGKPCRDVEGTGLTLRLCWVLWRSGAVPLDWQTGMVASFFFFKANRGCTYINGESHSSAYQGKSMPGF